MGCFAGSDSNRPQPIEPADVKLSALSPMQLHRLPVSRLSDEQLVYTQRRATLVGHRRFVEAVLKELVARPQCLEQVDGNRVYINLVDIAQIDGRFDEAIAWARQAKERAAKSKDQGAFEQTLSWTLTEFALRAEQPEDPELPALYRHLAEYYAPKVPHIAAVLEAFRQQNAERLPWLRNELLVGTRQRRARRRAACGRRSRPALAVARRREAVASGTGVGRHDVAV